MKLVRYLAPAGHTAAGGTRRGETWGAGDGVVRTGIMDARGVIDLVRALAGAPAVSAAERRAAASVPSLMGLGERALELLQLASQSDVTPCDPAEVLLLTPIEPRLILCSGENYWDHRDEKPVVDGREPEFFLKNPLGTIASGEAIRLDPRVTRKLDYEVELVVVIGRPGRHIPPARALEHVFGYTIMNDITARDRQVRLRPDGTAAYALGPGKSFDGSAPLGPCIVTRDEIPDPQCLDIRSRVNGIERQHNNTRNMIWPVAELVSFFSTYITLRPGVVISTGTPGGTGWGSDPELGGRPANGEGVTRYLQPGDVVECEIERIGILRNPVVLAEAGLAAVAG